jgi:hypothetical protein
VQSLVTSGMSSCRGAPGRGHAVCSGVVRGNRPVPVGRDHLKGRRIMPKQGDVHVVYRERGKRWRVEVTGNKRASGRRREPLTRAGDWPPGRSPSWSSTSRTARSASGAATETTRSRRAAKSRATRSRAESAGACYPFGAAKACARVSNVGTARSIPVRARTRRAKLSAGAAIAKLCSSCSIASRRP